MRNRPDYGNATPEDLARALLRPLGPRPAGHASTGDIRIGDDESERNARVDDPPHGPEVPEER